MHVYVDLCMYFCIYPCVLKTISSYPHPQFQSRATGFMVIFFCEKLASVTLSLYYVTESHLLYMVIPPLPFFAPPSNPIWALTLSARPCACPRHAAVHPLADDLIASSSDTPCRVLHRHPLGPILALTLCSRLPLLPLMRVLFSSHSASDIPRLASALAP